MIYIGIDPAKGWAEMDSATGRFTAVDTVNFWEIQERLLVLAKVHLDVKIFIEAPQNNRPIFFNYRRRRPTPQEIGNLLKLAQNVGENKAAAKLILLYAEKLFGKENVVALTPTKNSLTKMDAKRFAVQTGWTGRTSEHGRDAAMLVYGK